MERPVHSGFFPIFKMRWQLEVHPNRGVQSFIFLSLKSFNYHANSMENEVSGDASSKLDSRMKNVEKCATMRNAVLCSQQ